MLKRIFTLSNGALFVALSLSTIAAWYSIIGLTAIFAGAVVPIIIMGTALEFAKITTTVWLRKYWHRCSMIMKIYLVPAVVALALLTSMGIFGFLSKAHLDQNIGSGDVQAKVSLLDEKIAMQRENIKSSKAALAQMDTQVNDIMTKGDSERSVERSVMIRKQQAKERASLLKDIEVANKEIQKLNEERAPIASEMRKVEAEVGPIKYIAALIYGDNPDSNVLERAVRWVIILLVVVFDPLAIMLVLAANQSKDWDENDDAEEENKLREQVEHEKVMTELESEKPDAWVADVGEKPTQEELEDFTDINHELAEHAVVEETHIDEPKEVVEESILDKHPYLNKPFTHFEGMAPIVATKEEVVEEEQPVELEPHNPEPQILAFGVDVVERPGDYVVPPDLPEIIDITPKREEDNVPFEGVKVKGEWIQTGPDFADHPAVKTVSNGDYVLYNGKQMSMEALKGMHPELFLKADNYRDPMIDFGTQYPSVAEKGDTFVRTDTFPNRVFKFNGSNWIETNKELTDVYLSNEKYLNFLVQKLSTGEYDPEMLTPQEQDAVASHIQSK